MSWLLQHEADTLREIGRVFPFPDDYTVVDIETSGFSRDKDLIIAWGFGHIRGRKAQGYQEAVLDWTRHPQIDQVRLRRQLERIADEFRQKGRVWYYPIERLRAEGVDPIPALHRLVSLLYTALVGREKLVGHNAYGFDFPFIESASNRFLNGYELPWLTDSVYDTSLVEKSLLMQRPPWAGESLDEWQKRMKNGNVKAGQYYNLSPACSQKYRLLERFSVDSSRAHMPSTDCLLCHYLFETHRESVELLNGARQVLSQG